MNSILLLCKRVGKDAKEETRIPGIIEREQKKKWIEELKLNRT